MKLEDTFFVAGVGVGIIGTVLARAIDLASPYVFGFGEFAIVTIILGCVFIALGLWNLLKLRKVKK